MRRDITEKYNYENERRIKSHNAKMHAKKYNFEVDDFVLRGLLKKQGNTKLALRWKGHYKIPRT